MTAAVRSLSKRTRERLAACSAVGLHYWADHPAAGRVWAVDNHQRAHVVRIRYKAGIAQRSCQAVPFEAEQCDGAAEAVPYTVESDGEETADSVDLTA